MAKSITDVRSLARSHTDSAVKVLAGIMTQTSAPPAARVAAATAMLDRGWGKPPQESMVTANVDGSITFTWLPSK